MLRHNLLLAFRNFGRFKTTFLLNMAGMTTALACVLLIYLWVSDEMNVDAFHEHGDQLHQILEKNVTTDQIFIGKHTSGLLAETMAAQFPEVEYSVATRLRKARKTLSNGDQFARAAVMFASQDFFKAFSYDLLEGNIDEVLSEKKSIVISESLAITLFNTTENVIGEVVMLEYDQQFKVTGVFADISGNSSAQFDVLMPFELYKEIDSNVLDWNYNTTEVFVVLSEGSNHQVFNGKIKNFLKDKKENAKGSTLISQQYSDMYLYGNYEQGKQTGGRIEYVRLFSIIAFFILLIACINFVNLSTAKASRRIKEVGVRKAVGASKAKLVLQYLSESFLIIFLSLVTALIVVMVFLPQFNTITGKQLSLYLDFEFLLAVLSILMVTGIIAGSYPALYLSGFKPVRILKGQFNNSTGEVWTRSGLVVFQFAISIILIVCVWVIHNQIEFVQSKDLGYDKENIVHFEIEGNVAQNLETFLEELNNRPGVSRASSIGQSVVDGRNSFSIDSWEGKPENVVFPAFQMRPVNYDMIETLGVQIKQGRSFKDEFSSEDSKIIFNEAAIEMMGLVDPIGKTISIQGTKLEIIGVASNFHFASLREEVGPLFFVLQPSWTHIVMARIHAGREQEAIGAIEELYQSFNPGYPFDYQFLDQEYQSLYVAEQRVSTLSKYFTGLAIVISCLGLFGLAAFTAERRIKEIGIRKILGSSSFEIVQLLSKNFTKMVLTAVCISLPISYALTQHWLQNFAYHIELEWWIFIGAGLAALLIAWFTVGLQTLKAARTNPVETLRNE